MTSKFSHFIGIDWSGAKGRRHKGIAIACCAAGNAAPELVSPPSGKASWSRMECQDWIIGGMGFAEGDRALVGLDSAFSLPFVDEGGYLGSALKADDAQTLWGLVNETCVEAEDLYGGPFVESHKEYYHCPLNKGTRYQRRMRVAENLAVSSKAGPCESVFHLIGPSQVGLSGLSTMRMLSVLNEQKNIAIWPYKACDRSAITVVEIYAAAFAGLGGHKGKFRSVNDLNLALAQLGCQQLDVNNLDEHACDAVVTAAALREIAGERKYWHPAELSTKVQRTEGWVFGII